jgi:hypothetical protein
MNDTAKRKGRNVETYDYRNDFQILTSKEKRLILKNAKHLLKLQKGNAEMVVTALHSKKQEYISL